MNKNVLIIAGILFGATVGYFLRGAAGGPPFQTVTQLCFYKCEIAHTEKMNEIYNEYDSCMDRAEEIRNNAALICENPPGGQTRAACLSGVLSSYKDAKNACLKTRNDALAAEMAFYNQCREICQPNWEVSMKSKN